jgi:hypothetical protein
VLKNIIAIPANYSYVTAHGYISQRLGTSRCYSPANRFSGKTLRFNHGWTLRRQRACACGPTWKTNSIGGDTLKAGSSGACSLGPNEKQEEFRRHSQEKRRGPYRRGETKALAIDESPLGSA